MTLALELSFDAPSERRLQELCVTLSGLYPASGFLGMGGKPHVSLAVFGQGEPPHIERVVSELAARLSSFTLKLSAVGAFRSNEGVVFLTPEACSELRDAHAQMLAVLGAESSLIDAYYRPGTWHPHCTVAFKVPMPLMDTVIEACQREHTPFEASVRRLSAVRYRPAACISSAQLVSLD